MNLPTGAKTTSIASGPNLPAECRPEAANVFFKTTSPIGMHQCLTEGEWSEIAGGEGGSTSLAEHQIGFGSASNTVTGDAGFTFDPARLNDAILDLTESSTPNDSDMQSLGGAIINYTVHPNAFTGHIAYGLSVAYTNTDGNGVTNFGAGMRAILTGVASSSYFAGLQVTAGLAAGMGGNPDGINGIFVDPISSTTDDYNAGIEIGSVSGGMANYAIKTGAGDIVFGSLAGTGSRHVVVDANGKLSAP